MREQVAKAPINEIDPGDRPGQLGEHRSARGSDGQPIMLTSAKPSSARVSRVPRRQTRGPRPFPTGLTLSPRAASRRCPRPRARAPRREPQLRRGGGGQGVDGDGGVHKEKVRRSSQLKPLKPPGDGASPTVSAGITARQDGHERRLADGNGWREHATQFGERQHLRDVGGVGTPVLEGSRGGRQERAEKAIRQVAKKFRSLARAYSERSSLGAKPAPSTRRARGRALPRRGARPAGARVITDEDVQRPIEGFRPRALDRRRPGSREHRTRYS